MTEEIEQLDVSGILGEEAESDPTRRIHANQDLDMAGIEVIGFDMDYTLALYHQEAMDTLSVQLTVDKLIARGYPETIREIELDQEFIIRGLVVDKETGNIFKMTAV